jgi:Leucine Rich Repeat (LRR) protein
MAFVSRPTVNLNLWKHRLGRVPESVWEEADLETLVLADNDLTEVSASIGRLKKLRMLDLGHNALTCVPDSLGDLEGLSGFLYLHDNRLTSLPSSLARLKALRYLNISENAFENLPEGICAMQGLIELRVSDNPLGSRSGDRHCRPRGAKKRAPWDGSVSHGGKFARLDPAVTSFAGIALKKFGKDGSPVGRHRTSGLVRRSRGARLRDLSLVA